MRHVAIVSLCAIAAASVSGCQKAGDNNVERALESVNVIDQSNLNDIMLTVGDPDEAVTYFQRAVREKPDRIDLKRGLAKSLIRANKPTEAAIVLTDIIAGPGADNDDRVFLADAYIRANDWKKAEAVLNTIPPTHETFLRYKLEAMVADAGQRWSKADSFYETAVGLTQTPAAVLNNWGYSKLTRGDYPGAEKLFTQALSYDDKLFTAKNNLVLARAAQRKYDLPLIQLTQLEKAELLYTAALAAIKQGDVATGRALLQEAIDTHPQHFEEAARALGTLDANVNL
ncbi:MAG: tetratricopeptide repeat protein [Paracoccaceae bacterium]